MPERRQRRTVSSFGLPELVIATHPEIQECVHLDFPDQHVFRLVLHLRGPDADERVSLLHEYLRAKERRDWSLQFAEEPAPTLFPGYLMAFAVAALGVQLWEVSLELICSK